MKEIQTSHIATLIILTALVLIACNFTSRNVHLNEQPVESIITPTSESEPLALYLPADLYYLDDDQIWRFNRETLTIEKITSEPGRVDSFDFSNASQLLVYVSNNQLILTDKDGNQRQVLRSGSNLELITDDLVRLNDQSHISSAIRTPLWSQDGQQIAFVENGLNILSLETNQVVNLIENKVTFGRELVIENLLSWSPNTRFFLLSHYNLPLEKMSDRDTTVFCEENRYIGYPSANHAYNSGKLTFAWSPDSSQHYYADAHFGGLSAFIQCESGEDNCVYMGDERPAHTYYFYAHPFVVSEHELMVFIGTSGEPVEPPEKFRLYRMTNQGYDIRKLRSDAYVPESALWSPDGHGVLITLAEPMGDFQAGSVLWLTIDDQPAVLLPVKHPGNLRWGSGPSDNIVIPD